MVQISVNELLNQFEIAKGLIDKDPNEVGMLLYKVAESSLIMLAKKMLLAIMRKIITSNTNIFYFLKLQTNFQKLIKL